LKILQKIIIQFEEINYVIHLRVIVNLKTGNIFVSPDELLHDGIESNILELKNANSKDLIRTSVFSRGKNFYYTITPIKHKLKDKNIKEKYLNIMNKYFIKAGKEWNLKTY